MAKRTTLLDLAAAALSTTVETALVSPITGGPIGVTSDSQVRRRVIGIKLACADTAILKAFLGSTLVLSASVVSLNALAIVLALDIDVPDGETLKFVVGTSSATSACTLTVVVDETTAG